MDEPERVLTLRVKPEPQASRRAREAVSRFARENHVGEDDLDHFLTALGEALANAVEHAGPTEDPVEIEVIVGPGRIVATVQDRGIGFVPASTTQPELPAPTAERGRGLPIIRSCSDMFALTSAPGKGTAVVFGRFFRNAPGAATAA